MPSLLSVKNLTVRFDDFVVFENISFELAKGEILAVIGPNGGGKTTLLKVLLRLAQATSGQIHWSHQPKIGYVPQRFSVDRNFPLLTKEFLQLLTRRQVRIEDVSPALLHTPEVLDRRVGELSAGELQRVLIAGALLQHPDILLMDEPTADLDVRGEETVSHHLFHLVRERGLAVILVSHDLQIVFREVDKVLCLNREMVCFGEPSQVLTPTQLQKLYGGEVSMYQHREVSKAKERGGKP